MFVAVRPGTPLLGNLTAVPRENILNLPLRNSLDLVSAIRLGRFIREKQVDVTHAHVARDYPLATLASFYAGNVPLVITRHLTRHLSKFHRLTFSRVAAVIAPGEADARSLRKQKIVAEDKIAVVIYGIDWDRFDCESAPFDRETSRNNLCPDARFLIGIAGELREHKGQDIFIRAAAIIAAQYPDAYFLIAGEDNSPDKTYRAQLERLLTELKLHHRVRLLGWLDSVAPFYSALDVFVSASRVEPFGLVMVEAMASGVPVVATATEGAREVSSDGVNGRLTPVGDAEALAAAIINLLADERTRQQMVKPAQIAARERFGLERMINETESIYFSILKNQRAKTSLDAKNAFVSVEE